MKSNILTDRAISKETAFRLCSEIRQKSGGKWYTLTGLQCWGCTTFSKGDPTKMCLCSQAGYHGCNLVNARYDLEAHRLDNFSA